MNTKNFLITLFVFSSFVVGCSTMGDYQIDCNIVGTPSKKAYLIVYEGKQPIRIDSAEVKNGMFKFSGSLKNDMLASIEFPDYGYTKQFFIENAPIIVDGNFEEKKLVVTGSPSNDLYSKYVSNMPEDSFGYSLQFVKDNPSSVAAAYVLYRNLSWGIDDPDKLDSLVNIFDSKIQSSVYAMKVKDKVSKMRKTAVGMPFIEIALPDTSGNIVSLSSLLSEGKYVLVDFWASWCGPCRNENPNVVRAYKEFAHRGFTVYGVSLDKNADPWKKAIVSDGLNWTNVSDLKFWECVPAGEYGVMSIPSNFLISPDGKIVAKQLHGDQLRTKLREIFPRIEVAADSVKTE